MPERGGGKVPDSLQKVPQRFQSFEGGVPEIETFRVPDTVQRGCRVQRLYRVQRASCEEPVLIFGLHNAKPEWPSCSMSNVSQWVSLHYLNPSTSRSSKVFLPVLSVAKEALLDLADLEGTHGGLFFSGSVPDLDPPGLG